jgi:hypothetical protein
MTIDWSDYRRPRNSPQYRHGTTSSTRCPDCDCLLIDRTCPDDCADCGFGGEFYCPDCTRQFRDSPWGPGVTLVA